MSFSRGWRQRRAVAQHRAAVSKHGTTDYREYSQRQRENERRALRGEPPIVPESIPSRETPAEAKARRERDAIVIPTLPDDLDDAEEHETIAPRKLN